jgi:hypothetical protein
MEHIVAVGQASKLHQKRREIAAPSAHDEVVRLAQRAHHTRNAPANAL